MPKSVDDAIRILRIITAAMITGVLAFAAVVYFLRPTMRDLEGQPPAFAFLGFLALTALACATGYVVQYRKMVGSLRAQAVSLRQTDDPSEIVIGVYRTFAITGAGLIEGPSFFAVIAYLLTGHPLALAAVGLGVLLLVWHMPSRERVQRLVEDATEA